MKIANIVRRFSFEEWGGTETAVWNALLRMRADGIDAELVATQALCPVASEVREGVPIRRFPYFYPQLFLSKQNARVLDKKGGNPFSFDLYRYLMAGDFDLLHTHAMGRLAKLVRKAARAKGIPYVVSFHGGQYDVPASEFEEMAKPLKGSLGYGGVLERALGLRCDIVAEADGIICVGQNEYEEMCRRFPGKPAAYIPNGVDASKFERVPQADFRATYHIPAGRTLLLCVSRIDYQKNQIAMLRLAQTLRARGEDVHCAIVGFVTSAAYGDALRAAAGQCGLDGRVSIVEGLPPDSDLLLAAYRQADVFVLPSVHEPFGIVVLEAWSAHVPVMASAVGGLKTLVKEGVNGVLFDAADVASMVSAYDRLRANADAVRRQGALEVREVYSWDAVVKQILKFYKDLC